MKLLAVLSDTVARTALPRALQALAACKKHRKNLITLLCLLYIKLGLIKNIKV
jgi:hypothetical protein